MSRRTGPLFRADHVGSLRRPRRLLQAPAISRSAGSRQLTSGRWRIFRFPLDPISIRIWKSSGRIWPLPVTNAWFSVTGLLLIGLACWPCIKPASGVPGAGAASVPAGVTGN